MTTEKDLLALAMENDQLRAENKRLSRKLGIATQNYDRATESIANKDKMIADRDRIILEAWIRGYAHERPSGQ